MPLSAKLSDSLFAAKSRASLTFADLGAHLSRSEVSTAAIFYGQTRATPGDIFALSNALSMPEDALLELGEFPERGAGVEMPPKEPLVYRLYEILVNYGQAYKAVINEKFGDGIMSAIAFSTKVEKEVEEDGSEWVVLTMRGKWLPYKRF